MRASSVKKIADERFAVGGEGERLADFALGENGIFQVEAEIAEVRAGALQ